MKPMKYFMMACFGLLTAVSAKAQQFNILSESGASLTIAVSPGEWSHTEVNTSQGNAWLISLPDGHSMLKAGAPDLPALYTTLAVHEYLEMEVSVLESHYYEIPGVLVAPCKGNLQRTIDPATVPYTFGALYQSDAFFPESPAMLGKAFIEGAVRGQALRICPFQYNPLTQVLRVYDQLVVQVTPSAQMGENAMTGEHVASINEVMDEMYRARYLNYQSIKERYNVVPEIGNLLVITAPQYMDELEPWVQWKKEKGIPTQVVSISDVGNTVNAIKTYVSNYYNNNGLTYLVLVGDENQITSPLLNNSGGQGYCDPCYGQIAGNDSYAEVFVGRFLVHTEAELTPFIAKTLEYEKNPYVAADWFSIGIGIGSNEGDGIGDDNEADWQHQNEMKAELIGYTYTKIWELYDGNHTNASPTGGETADGSGNPNTSALANLINTGCSLINYTGHGSHNSIATTGFTNNNINSLNNAHKFPFFIIVGCCVGDFDDDDASGDTFGERWIKTTNNGEPTGGIGGMFSSVYQTWAPPMEGQDEMNHIICELVNYETRHTLGSIANHGCASMNDVYGQGGADMTDTWILMADPTVQLRTAFPSNLTVNFDSPVAFGTSEVLIYCNTENAMVCLSMGGEILGTGIVSGGVATVNIASALQPGDILVTVTSFNTIPYQGYLQLQLAQGPYVVSQSQVASDVLGNNNGWADYLETIVVNSTLKNVGIETAMGVEAMLSSNDPYVVITDNYEYFGDIESMNVLLLNGAFAFDVVDGVPNQHIANFTVTISDSDENTWSGSFNVKLYAPALVCADGITINDSAGNNNGRLDDGESVIISVPVLNNGHSLSQAANCMLSSMSPYITITDGTDSTPGINAAGQQVAQFNATVATGVPVGATINFYFSAQAGMYGSECSYNKLVNLAVEDWETGNTNSFPWSLSGASNWFTTGLQPYEGSYCMQSGAIGDGANTVLSITIVVTEPGTIGYAARVSSEQGWDYLRFRIDNTLQGQWSGELPWTEYSFPITAGTHTLRWTYSKDAFCCAEGSDAAWVDNVVFPPFTTISSAVTEHVYTLDAQLYPNPVSEDATLALSTGKAGPVWAAIYSATGQLVWSQQLNQVAEGRTLIQLNTASLSSGMYRLVLHQNGQHITCPFVKN